MSKLLLLAFVVMVNPALAAVDEAIFAGGSFWRMEAQFSQLKGVLGTVSGFDGGKSKDPTYTQVANGRTDYVEAVRVIYNPKEVSYKELVEFFWHHIDPMKADGQFCDEGKQFNSAIFYLNDKQKAIALASKKTILKKMGKIFTSIAPSTQFYAADYYHQNYYLKHPLRYKYYHYRCGQEERIEELWGSN